MKKIYLITMMPLLTSCVNTQVIDLKSITWKSEIFNIVATSEQLQNQYYKTFDECPSNYFSSLSFNGKAYRCKVYFVNRCFNIVLKDELNNTTFAYGNIEFFLDGTYSGPIKQKNKDYVYILKIDLFEIGQYYNYCIDNGIDFVNQTVFYGYKTN